MMHTLEADGIELSFGDRKILGDVYIRCRTGEITGLLGRNGQGKSCLMNIMYGSLKAQSRSIRFDEHSEFKAFKNPSLLTYLPQFSFIPPSLTLKRVFNDFNISFSGFELFLPEFEGRIATKIKNLSGGERRLVEVYLIIKSKSRFTILDEPFSHIMPLHLEKIKDLLLKEKANKGFFITDHMYQAVIDISDQTYVLKDGKTHLTHSTDDIEWLGYARF
jgi:ABC-type multidrug transport system ATPase subunit